MQKNEFIISGIRMKLSAIALCVFIAISSFSQNSKLWEEYKNAQENGTKAKLPNFSFAGYKYSEVPIPDVSGKIFNVINFGADPSGKISSKTAIKKAIEAAEANGSGIVFFPKGKYLINAENDELDVISIKKSNIVFRGEGNSADGTVLFFEKDLPPTDPTKLWTCPSAIQVSVQGKDPLLAKVIADTDRETFAVKVDNPSKIKVGDWVILKVENNAADLIDYDIQPLKAEKEWSSILENGVVFNERHQVKGVHGNLITFREPIHYDIQSKHGWTIHRFDHVENIGFENILFEGNWKTPFLHHKNAQHDGGWSILTLSRSVNSWVRNCTFKNVSIAVGFSQSAYCTSLNNTIVGNYGHSAISAGGGSTGILIAANTDHAGQWHTFGVQGGSTTGTVIWRCKHPEYTSFESHASQPRCTLFDNSEGGFFLGRGGGARQNLPNHGRYLVLWNYHETDEGEQDFEFWSRKTWYWKIVPPIIVGFHGAGTTFKMSDVDVVESLGKRVNPESLWEEQLKLRLGKLPEWIQKVKKELPTTVVKRELLFEDDCTQDWRNNWMLDGEKGTVINNENGMELIAGSDFRNDSCHTVLWTQKEFKGNICIEYDYTRTDTASRFVNILYFMATGKGDSNYPADISLWNEKRKVPYMQTYFNNMNAYHISYAAYPTEYGANNTDYIRLRRYMPGGNGLKNTDVAGDIFDTGLFKYGIPYHVKVTLIGTSVEMQVWNKQNVQEKKVYRWDASAFPKCTEGRIGLRHMYTRSASYKNFKVWGLLVP